MFLDDFKFLEIDLWVKGNFRVISVIFWWIWVEGGILYEKNDNDVLNVEGLDFLVDVVKYVFVGGYKVDIF